VDIILGRERRRWPLEVKRAIVAETIASGEVSSVARRHGAAPSMVFAWRKQLGAPPLRQGRAGTEAEASAASPDSALVSLSGSPTASGDVERERSGRRCKAVAELPDEGVGEAHQGFQFRRVLKSGDRWLRAEVEPVSGRRPHASFKAGSPHRRSKSFPSSYPLAIANTRARKMEP
jgi:transposase-like protein